MANEFEQLRTELEALANQNQALKLTGKSAFDLQLMLDGKTCSCGFNSVDRLIVIYLERNEQLTPGRGADEEYVLRDGRASYWNEEGQECVLTVRQLAAQLCSSLGSR